jgi:hypothetical protein
MGVWVLIFPVIIDVHSHAWCYPGHFDDDFREQAKKAQGDV